MNQPLNCRALLLGFLVICAFITGCASAVYDSKNTPIDPSEYKEVKASGGASRKLPSRVVNAIGTDRAGRMEESRFLQASPQSKANFRIKYTSRGQGGMLLGSVVRGTIECESLQSGLLRCARSTDYGAQQLPVSQGLYAYGGLIPLAAFHSEEPTLFVERIAERTGSHSADGQLFFDVLVSGSGVWFITKGHERIVCYKTAAKVGGVSPPPDSLSRFGAISELACTSGYTSLINMPDIIDRSDQRYYWIERLAVAIPVDLFGTTRHGFSIGGVHHLYGSMGATRTDLPDGLRLTLEEFEISEIGGAP